MIVFPLIAAAVSAAFSFLLLRQWATRRRLPQLAWGVAMGMFAVASLTVALGIGSGWDVFTYKMFWLFGALLTVPWLALGSVALVSKRPVALAALAAVGLLSLYGVFSVLATGVHRAALITDSIPRGRDAWGRGSHQVLLARYYSIIAWIVVVGIAFWSSQPRKGVRPPAERVRGNLLIAAGVSIVAIGGFALGRVGRGAAFSVTLAIGVTVMFLGFLFASRASRPPGTTGSAQQ